MNIHDNLAGKTVEAALTDGERLILRLTTGQELRIEWQDGEPTLTGIDVRIVLPATAINSAVGVM